MKKKNIIAISILAFLLLVAISFSISYAWYTNTSKIGKINAETKDLSFVYKFDSDSELNVNEYEIKNLTFFDIDAENELKYLDIMAVHITLNLENTSSGSVNYSVSFDSVKNQEKDSNDNLLSNAYVEAIVSTTELTFTPANGETIISDYLIDDKNTVDIIEYRTKSGSLAGSTGSNANSMTTLHLYLFGVQEIDSASNSMFLTEADIYTFTLTVRAQGTTTEPDIITTTPTVSTPAQ